MKFILLVILALMWGGAQWAKADDEISCASGDNECVNGKVELGYKRFKAEQREERKQRRRRAKEKAEKAEEKGYKPCAADDDCQRTGQDAADRENGKFGQDD